MSKLRAMAAIKNVFQISSPAAIFTTKMIDQKVFLIADDALDWARELA